MAKFNKDDFLDANRDAKDSSFGDFKDIDNGMYIATLERCEIKESKKPDSKAENVSFGWQIDADSDHFPNQYVWVNQNIVMQDGSSNPTGLRIVNQIFMQLAEGQFDPDAFVEDPKGEIVRFLGTQARIQVKQLGDDGYGMKYRVTIKQILKNTYQIEALDTGDEDPDENSSIAKDEDEDEGEAERGKPVIFTLKGKQQYGKIVNFIDDPSGEGGILEIQPCKIDNTKGQTEEAFVPKKTNTVMVKAEDVVLADLSKTQTEDEVEDEEEIEDEDAPKRDWKKGDKVSYEWNGKTLTTTVHSVDEDEGILKVIAHKNGKKVARKVKMEDVIPF